MGPGPGASHVIRVGLYQLWLIYGPGPLKSTQRHVHLINSTCVIGLSDVQQRPTSIVTWDI